MDEEDCPNSQEFSTQDFEKEIANDTEEKFQEETFDEPTMDTTPLKKRRVNNTGAAAAAPANEETSYSPRPRALVCNKLCIPLPPSAVLFDVKTFLHEYQPGFGHQYEEQVTLVNYGHYPTVLSACVEVPVYDVEAFQAFVESHLFFGKYKTVAEVLTENQTVTPAATLDNDEYQKHLEIMAKDYLIQHVKHATHPKHDVDLNYVILDGKSGGEVMQHYLKHWLKDGNFTESKLPSNPVNVLEEAIKAKNAEDKLVSHKWGIDWNF